jgi:SNF2 family DNA or RNA helicase
MLGRSGAFASLTKTGRSRDDDEGALPLLAHALRPFLLRRTKEQVLRELPEKTEQTLYCEMTPKQRKLYDELRDYYRSSLKDRVAEVGLAKAKIHVLEALLRLRQAACHPGLIDPKRTAEASAKLELLMEQIEEVVSEGHKALIFSQFTSLLAIVRQQFDQHGVVYAYLDGQTRNREQIVKRFQQDAQCPVFLISLKAGGQGLNLTAADYVYILDPWWNPAVEAQAVDRAHRIGQDRHVFAYRLICRDSVEEKIIELQREKRELADAIVSADNSVIGSLTAEDLQLLLS